MNLSDPASDSIQDLVSLGTLPTDVTGVVEQYGSHCRLSGKEVWKLQYYCSWFDQRFAAADGIMVRTEGPRVVVYFKSELYSQFQTENYIPCIKIFNNEIYVLNRNDGNTNIDVYSFHGDKLRNLKIDICRKENNFEIDSQKFIMNSVGEFIFMTMQSSAKNCDVLPHVRTEAASESTKEPSRHDVIGNKFIVIYSNDGHLLYDFEIVNSHSNSLLRMLGSTFNGDICIAEGQTKIYRYSKFGKLRNVCDIALRYPAINYAECCTSHGDFVFSILSGDFSDRLFISNQNCDALLEITHKFPYQIISICATQTGRIIVVHSPFVSCIQ